MRINYIPKELKAKFFSHLRYYHSGKHRERQAEKDYHKIDKCFP